jgi:hypothetical protein
MKRTITHVAPWLAAAAIGGALVFAPIASAAPVHEPPSPSQGTQSESGADPDTPFGANAPGDEFSYDEQSVQP